MEQGQDYVRVHETICLVMQREKRGGLGARVFGY